MARVYFILLAIAAGYDAYTFDGKYLNAAVAIMRSTLRHFGI
jgi:hypothetical protein